MKALINSAIWNDPDFESLSTSAKLVVFWLWTNPGRDMAGCVRVSLKRLAFDTGIDSPAVALEEALASGSYVKHDDRIWIESWISRQIGQGEALKKNNMYKPLKKAAASAPVEIRRRIFARYPELQESPLKAPITEIEGASEAPTEGQGKGREGKEGVIKGETPETLPNRINRFIEELAAVYGSKPHLLSQEGRRAVFLRGITEKEARQVVAFVKAHRRGKFKDSPAIAQTCSAALEGIGKLIERAMASKIPKPDDLRAKPMPRASWEDNPEPTAEAKEAIASQIQEFKKTHTR